ncbi:MAG: hypothetical protein AAGF45_02340 [Pseudomonadota bacterium]
MPRVFPKIALAMVLFVASVGSPSANDAACTAPATPTERAVCSDDYLRGLDAQITVVLSNFAFINGGEAPLGVDMESAHYMIAREECGESFRCVEAQLREHLTWIEDQYLSWQDTPLSAGLGTAITVVEAAASAGHDLIPSKDARNFGWTQRLCGLRCGADPACAGAHYVALAQQDGVYGYCTLKSRIVEPLQPWRGVTLIKR